MEIDIKTLAEVISGLFAAGVLLWRIAKANAATQAAITASEHRAEQRHTEESRAQEARIARLQSAMNDRITALDKDLTKQLHALGSRIQTTEDKVGQHSEEIAIGREARGKIHGRMDQLTERTVTLEARGATA